MKRLIPIFVAIGLTVIFFWQFFVKGFIPIPASYQMVWYEPWKTQFSVNGVPAISHKAVGDDVFRQLYPFKTLATDLFRHNRLPFWNPYNGGGQPLLANLHPGYVNPLSITLFLPNVSGWAWYIMLHLPLLFLTTYCYLRSLRQSRFAGYVAGVIVIFSGAVVVRYIFGEFLFSFAMLPLVLLCIENLRNGKNDAMLWIPFAVALMLVSVQPQISAYGLLIVLLYGLVRLQTRRFMFACMMTLGIGLSAFQLIPTLELYRLANVTSNSSAFIFQKFLMPAQHLITVLIPNYFGNSGTYNYWGKTDYVETVVSMGMIPITLTLFAFRKKSQVVWFFVWAAVASVFLTLDWFVPRQLYQVPSPVLSTSIPTRMYLFTAFFVAVLTGFGVDWWEHAVKKDFKNIAVTTGTFFLFGILVLAGTLYLKKTGGITCPSQVANCATVALRNTIFELMVFVCGSVMLVVPLMWKEMRRLSMIGVVTLLAVAGMYNGWKFLPMSPKEYVGKIEPVIAELQRVAPSRVAGFGAASFATDFATEYRYFDTNYYDPLYIRRYGELVSYVNTGDRLKGLTRSDVNVNTEATRDIDFAYRRQRFWDMTGTSVIITKKDDKVHIVDPIIWEDSNWQINKRPGALPRAYLVTDVRVNPDPDLMLKEMFSDDVHIAKTVFVEKPIFGVNVGQAATGSAIITSYTPNRVTIRAISSTDAFLVLSDTFYPGWYATVDGAQTEIYRTNYAFRGIVLPKGNHAVTFRYEPESFTAGFWISIASLLVLLVWVGLYWYNRMLNGAVAKR